MEKVIDINGLKRFRERFRSELDGWYGLTSMSNRLYNVEKKATSADEHATEAFKKVDYINNGDAGDITYKYKITTNSDVVQSPADYDVYVGVYDAIGNLVNTHSIHMEDIKDVGIVINDEIKINWNGNIWSIYAADLNKYYLFDCIPWTQDSIHEPGVSGNDGHGNFYKIESAYFRAGVAYKEIGTITVSNQRFEFIGGCNYVNYRQGVTLEAKLSATDTTVTSLNSNYESLNTTVTNISPIVTQNQTDVAALQEQVRLLWEEIYKYHPVDDSTEDTTE